jgi:hypothetical protein
METNKIKIFNTRNILLLILAINIVLGMVFFFAHPDSSFWKNIWEYLGSSVFMLVTGSLLIPLLLSLFEKQYKFIENLQQQREERRKQIEEQRRIQRQQAINDTIGMWQELYSQTSEVIFFDPAKDTDKLNDLIIRMINFTSTAEHIVNKWTHQFPNLELEDHDVFLHYINIIYQSGLTTIFYIRQGQDEKEIRLMQDMLFMIQDQLKNIANHRIINTLKYAARALELEEAGESPEEVARAKRMMDAEIEILRNWAKAISGLDEDYDNFMSPAEGQHIDELRALGRKIQSWLKEDKNRFVGQHQEFPEFERQFNNIILEERLHSMMAPYSKEYIRALADWFSLESACDYIYNRAHGIW